MRREYKALSRIYRVKLSDHLRRWPKASLRPALRLGHRAVKLGMETLDMAVIHEQALLAQVLSVASPSAQDQIIKRAKSFFAEAIVPLEETHRSAVEAVDHLARLNRALSQRTMDLAVSNRHLKKEIARRTAVEMSLRKSERQSYALLEQSRSQHDQLRLLSRRILSVQEEERKRISRELHDVIAQMLSGINVRLATLKTEATSSSKKLCGKITHTQRLVERSVDVVHRFARELRPAVLDDLGLIPALHTFMKSFSKQTGISVKLTVFAGVEKMSIVKRTTLYRVAHEALTNVASHARAGQVAVTIRRSEKAVCMDISDNGRGFDLKRVNRSKRLGLLGIGERVEMVGGKVTVTSEPGKGATIRAMIPFKNGAKENTHS